MPDSMYITRQPTLCMVVGAPASGKTSVSMGISAKLTDAAYLSKDLIQSAFTMEERVSGETYAMISGPTFQIMVDFADVQLKLGKTPIIDAPFSINHWRNDEFSDWVTPFRNVSNQYDARLAIIRCRPPNEEVLRSRIENRGYAWDVWKLENWDEFLNREPLDFPIPHDDVFEAVTDRTSEQLIENILHNYLKVEKMRLK